MTISDLTNKYDSAAPRWGKSLSRRGYNTAYNDFVRHSLANNSAAKSVCDIGTGSGALAQSYLTERPRPVQLSLVDPSLQMLTYAAKSLRNGNFDVQKFHHSLEEHSPKNPYDVVLAAHVIEHSPSPTKSLAHLWQLVAPGGTLLLVVSRPHWCQWLIWLRWQHQ